MSHDEISKFLKDCHVGCLPMLQIKNVDTIEARIPSSGLVVVGIDHSGHRLMAILNQYSSAIRSISVLSLLIGLNQQSLIRDSMNYHQHLETTLKQITLEDHLSNLLKCSRINDLRIVFNPLLTNILLREFTSRVDQITHSYFLNLDNLVLPILKIIIIC